jgi:hypothetical protein
MMHRHVVKNSKLGQIVRRSFVRIREGRTWIRTMSGWESSGMRSVGPWGTATTVPC